MASETQKCLYIIVVKCYQHEEDWIWDLMNSCIITKKQAASFKTRIRNDETAQVLEETCKLALEHRDVGQFDAFKDEDFAGNPKFADIILKVICDEKLCQSIIWMIESWDILSGSNDIRLEAYKYCEILSESNWFLDFIHHMLISADSNKREKFLETAKKLLGNGVPIDNVPSDSNNFGSHMETDLDDNHEDDSAIHKVDLSKFGSLDSEGENDKTHGQLVSPEDENATSTTYDSFEIISLEHDISQDSKSSDQGECLEDGEIEPTAKHLAKGFSQDLDTVKCGVKTSSLQKREDQIQIKIQEQRAQYAEFEDSRDMGCQSTDVESQPDDKPKPKPTPRKTINIPAQEFCSLPAASNASEHGEVEAESRYALRSHNLNTHNMSLPAAVGVGSSMESSISTTPKPKKRKKPPQSQDSQLEKSSPLEGSCSGGSKENTNAIVDRNETHVDKDIPTFQEKTVGTVGTDSRDVKVEKKNYQCAEDKTAIKKDRSRSGSYSGSTDERNSVNALISSLDKLKEFQHNLEVVVKLVWPQNPGILEQWPYELIAFLVDDEKENMLANHFADICMKIMEMTKPISAKYTRARIPPPVVWVAKNHEMVERNSSITIDLCRLMWSGDKWHSEKILSELITKCTTSPSKANAVIDVLSSLSKIQEVPVHQAEKSDELSKAGKPIDGAKNLSSKVAIHTPIAGPLTGNQRSSEIKSFLGRSKPEKPPVPPKPQQTQSMNSSHGMDVTKDGPNSSGVKLKTYQKNGRQNVPSTQNSCELRDSAADDNLKLQPSIVTYEPGDHFYDALDVPPVATPPKSDDSIEVRVVFTTYTPECTEMYLNENCWNEWGKILMRHNKERNFYFAVIPRKKENYDFLYKYSVRISRGSEYWEYLPSRNDIHVNRIASIKKDTRFLHDIPVFNLSRESAQDVIANNAYMHLPIVNTSDRDAGTLHVLQQQEIWSCIAQFKRGWITTAEKFYHMYISNRDLECNIMVWISRYIQIAKTSKQKIMRVLAVLQLTCSLYKLQHKMGHTQFLISIFAGLGIQTMDTSNLKNLRELIEQYFSNGGSVPLTDVFNKFFRKINDIVSSSSASFEWILSVPLYWMVVQDGEDYRKRLKSRKSGGPLFQKSMLPIVDKLSWHSVAKECESAHCQKYLMTMSEVILDCAGNFPWIVDTFLYFLHRTTLLDIIKNRRDHAISSHFSLDSVLDILCLRGIRYDKSKALLDAVQTEKYFEECFKKISEGDLRCSTTGIEGLIESTKAMLKILSLVIDDVNTSSFTNESKMIMFVMKIANLAGKQIFHSIRNKEDGEWSVNILHEIFTKFCQKIHRWSILDTRELQFINGVLTLQWPEPRLIKFFTSRIIADVKRLVKASWKNKKKEFFKNYLETWKKMSFEKPLDECLQQYALQCMESLLQDRHWSGWWGYSGKEFSMKMILQQYYQISNSTEVRSSRPVMHCLYFISKWPFASRIFQAFLADQSLVNSSDDNARRVNQIVSDFRQLITCFCKGSLTVSESNFVLQNEKAISEFYNIIHEGSNGSNVDMKLADEMQLTRKRLELIEWAILSLTCFVSLCDSIRHDAVVIHSEELKELSLLKDPMMKEILHYKQRKPLEIMSNEALSRQDIAELRLLQSASRGQTFEPVWENAVWQFFQQISENDVEHICRWRDILDTVWRETVKKRLASIAHEIFSGSLHVSVLSQLFSPEVKRMEIAAELEILAKFVTEPTTNILNQRVDQIIQYFRLISGTKVAKNIQRLKRLLELTSNFANVDFAKRIKNNEDVPLQSIVITHADTDIDEIWTSKELSEVLENFVKQRQLLKWLTKTMKNLGEVKTFCDLGMISAGESPMEVDRISCFLSAVTGFAPLIYNLKIDANLTDVVNALIAVKKNFDADKNLLKKWVDTGTHLERLIKIGELHGSESTQSLALAKSINRGGVYIISNNKPAMPTMDACLELSLRNGGTEKRYSYADLKDLQSKLMLIAGDAEQGQNDVKKFNDTMNSLANLTEVFVNLLKSGCMLFNTWSATIMCKKDGFVISIGFDENVQPISMLSQHSELEQLIVVLNDALCSWNSYINIMRLKHYHLNDFSISQISYLCEKLAKSQFEDQVFGLLSDLPQEKVEGHLQDIIEEATIVVENDDVAEIADNPNEEQETKLDAKKRIVRRLVKQGIFENVAKAAVQYEENNLDITDCEMWILNHQNDSDLVSTLAEEFDVESGFSHDSKSSDKPVSLLHNRTESTLAQLISDIQSIVNSEENVGVSGIVRVICKKYSDRTTKLTLQDFLSIDHLGKFLGILRSRLYERRNRVQREITAPMEKGKPNLILVPLQDMFLATVALYMDNEMEQPLPTASEVLVCTQNTTTDEVGRFLRRAMCKNPIEERRLYVMTHADQLTFTVSEYVEKLFHILSTEDCLDSNYQLVILSDSADPQHYLVTCFERSRVEMKISYELENLSCYVCKNLKAKPSDIPSNHETSAKLVLSNRSGVGKSLHIRRLIENIDETTHVSIVRLLEQQIDIDHMLKILYRGSAKRNENAHLIHIDLTSAVQHGLEEFAFNLFILRSIQDSQGQIWHHHCQHFYAIEMNKSKMLQQHSVLNLLPRTECLAPNEVLTIYRNPTSQKELNRYILMDEKEFLSDVFQRPYQYLCRYSKNLNLDNFTYIHPQGSKEECLEILLHYCGMVNPTWAQLKYFSTFLNIQLKNCEESIFCKRIEGAGRNEAIEFKGFKAFSVYFMIKMAQDFTTPSLKISDESTKDVKDALESKDIRRRWEDQVHPFVFFNEDRVTMTFINVNVNNNGDLLNSNGSIEKKNMVSKSLLQELKRQGIPIGRKFDSLNRKEQLSVLCQFMNIPHSFDPDETYELTTDNVLKILALYMRLRCQIPVIVMGETGCGKTRMIEFMSKLKQGPLKAAKTKVLGRISATETNVSAERVTGDNTSFGKAPELSNMIVLKVHGGISSADIYACVENAIHKAKENPKKGNETSALLSCTTTLFFDEANTTRAIYAIKEAVCDLTIDGKDFKDSHLQIIAACNPYKKLSKKAVKKLEESGLGYNINASATEHLGGVPMRQLVYRVVSLPSSLQPFVWDFGQLGRNAEEMYIRQMTNHLVHKLKLNASDASLINVILFRSQCHMRSKCADECRYVSLRDVERCLKTFEWFFNHKDHIFPNLKEHHKEKKRNYPEHKMLMDIPDCLRCLIQTVGVCYYASLDDRKSFLTMVSNVLADYGGNFGLSASQIGLEIIACQTIFTQDLKMEDNIACNEALRENVFLMTVCTDLRIPLFVVGKPGSSKSLAKTILSDNMQGKSSQSELYKNFKEVHIVAYQCSAHTDAAGIETIFNQCSQLQSTQNIDSYASVVVLDEIGLAEDSPNMPLKVLHPLLECGSTVNGTLTEFDNKKKVAFIGISNWALDPAKMNRGIFVTRGKPSSSDLFSTADKIFKERKNQYGGKIKSLTKAYQKVYKNQNREYFGLRDYYSLMKMLQASVYDGVLTDDAIQRAIQRNFSGQTGNEINEFYNELSFITPAPLIPVQEMVKENLNDDKSRFLLLLANQYSSFSLLQNFIPNFSKNVQVIFGSSFPNDHSYTEICRNINRVKVCMEQGRTVILLNLTEINESLYDALNQHYVTFGGERYVDVALGGHRVKCKVAAGFRLIVIELKDKVYNEYPIPLINRLEKHHLTSESLLSEDQNIISNTLNQWIDEFSCISNLQFTVPDAFLGHNDDSVSSVVICHCESDEDTMKKVLLQSATMDAVFRLPRSRLGGEGSWLLNTYMNEQFHGNLYELLRHQLESDISGPPPLLEITTFSHIMSDSDRRELEKQLGIGKNTVMLLSLQQFQTEQEYLKKLDEFFNYCDKANEKSKATVGVLLVQCPQAHKHVQLIACARYGLRNRMSHSKFKKRAIVAMMLSTERGLKRTQKSDGDKELSLQHNNDCQIVYVDELRSTSRSVRKTRQLHESSITVILRDGLEFFRGKEEDEKVIDLPTLIKDCVCEAMTKVKNSEKDGRRNLERIQLLSQLCAADSHTGYKFLEILTKKMIKIFDERDLSDSVNSGNWVENEARSPEKLQEGGTFSKTLWLCLRSHVSRIMAYVLSIVDKEDNLDLITKEEEVHKPVHKAWLRLFSVCPFTWKDVMGSYEFTISAKKLCDAVGGVIRIPFVFHIYDTFEKIWSAQKKNTNEVNTTVSCNVFANNHVKLSKALKDATFLSEKYLVAYASEILQMGLSTQANTIEALAKVVVRIAVEMQHDMKSQDENSECNMFLLVYLATKKYYREIMVLDASMQLHQPCMEQLNKWMEEFNNQGTQMVYRFAMDFLLDEASKKALEIKDSVSCLLWMDFINKTRSIFHNAIDLIDKSQDKAALIKKWEPVAILDMLLLHLLPDPSQKDQFNNYIGVISTQAKLLFKGARKLEVNGQQFIRIVCNILHRHFQDIQLKILIGWGNNMCRICRKDCNHPIVLTCGHYFCCDCLAKHLQAIQGPKKCFACSKLLASDFNCEPSALTHTQQLEVSEFKRSCTSLFLEYLSQFVFRQQNAELQSSGNSAGDIQLIVEELVVANDYKQGKSKLDTHGLDLNQATRSSIITTLWNYDRDETATTITGILEHEPKEVFVAVLLHFEMMIKLKEYPNTGARLQDCIGHLKSYAHSTKSGPVKMSSEYITLLAAARCAIVNFVIAITNEDWRDEAIESLINSLIYNIKSIVGAQRDESMMEFMIKVGCRMYGLSWFSETLMKNERLKALVPKKLHLRQQSKILDMFASLGPEYRGLRSQLQKTSLVEHSEAVKNWLHCSVNDPLDSKTFEKLLAIIMWVNENDSCRDLYQAHFSKMPEKISTTFGMMMWVMKNLWPLITKYAKGSEQQTFTMKQLIILISGVIQLDTPFMVNMKLMMEDPDKVRQKFWPSMPESFYFSLPESVRKVGGIDATYECPNGHIYTIGQCTRPWQQALCADCGAVIGGARHESAEGNRRMEKMEESTQAGYMLNRNKKNLQQPHDRISMQASSVIQLLIHVCMLHGFQRNPASAIRILGKQVHWAQYLIKEIERNLTEFSKAIGRNKDDGILIIFSAIDKMLHDLTNNQLPTKVAHWDSMESRKAWENQFRETCLLPIFQNLDQILEDAHENLSNAEDMTSINLFRLVYEISDHVEEHKLPLWDYTHHPSVHHLMQCIRDGASLQKGSVLQAILKTHQIENLKYLEGILSMQHAAVSKYQNDIDLRVSEEIKIRDFSSNSELVNNYMEAWNMMRNQLQGHAKTDKQMQVWFEEDLTPSSPISSLLPSTRGRGKCAKLLTEVLTEKHNGFLQKCFEITGVKVCEREAEVSMLTSNHFLSIDTKSDLLSMIYLHTSHHMKEDKLGKHQHITYNLDSLEKQARERFLSNKKMILLESLPCIKYPQDIGIGSDWNAVSQKTKQEALSPRLVQAVNDRINNVTSAEVCEGVRTLTYAISFLAKVECDPNRQILDYLEKDLLLPKARTAVIPRFAKIQHTLALYQHFTWRKAVGFVQQGLQPYKEVLSQINEERIADEKIIRSIERAFQHMDVVLFQQRLNEMLIQIPDFNGDWSLVDLIFPYLTFIGSAEEDSAWFDKIPSEVMFKQVSHIFELAVNHGLTGST